MARYRSSLSLILVIVATFLVSCGSPTVSKVTKTYTAAQVEQIQQYVPDIVALRDRMSEIPTFIKRSDWINVSNFIHGPIAELRLKMTYVTRNLLPNDQQTAREAIRGLLDHLVKIEESAQEGNAQQVVLNYREAVADINTFLEVVPQPTAASGAE